MRPFDHPNVENGWKCPICGTQDDKPVVLIGIDGTQEGKNIQAEQYHLHCIDLTEFRRDDYSCTYLLMKFIDKREETPSDDTPRDDRKD